MWYLTSLAEDMRETLCGTKSLVYLPKTNILKTGLSKTFPIKAIISSRIASYTHHYLRGNDLSFFFLQLEGKIDRNFLEVYISTSLKIRVILFL